MGTLRVQMSDTESDDFLLMRFLVSKTSSLTISVSTICISLWLFHTIHSLLSLLPLSPSFSLSLADSFDLVFASIHSSKRKELSLLVVSCWQTGHTSADGTISKPAVAHIRTDSSTASQASTGKTMHISFAVIVRDEIREIHPVFFADNYRSTPRTFFPCQIFFKGVPTH